MLNLNLSVGDYKILSTFLRKRNKYYHVYIEYMDFNEDKKKQKSVFRSESKKEAENSLLEVKYLVSKNQLIIPQEITLVERCLSEIENYSSDYSPYTIKNYTSFVTHVVKPYFRDTKLKDITVSHIEGFFKYCELKYSMSTIKIYKAMLASFFNNFYRKKEISENPFHFLTNRRTKKKSISDKDNFFDKDEAILFNKCIQGNHFELVFKLILHMGLRPGEACGLTWDDIDFDNKTLQVRNTLITISGEFLLNSPKTTSSLRTLLIPESLLSLMKAQKIKQNELKLAGLLDNKLNLVNLRLNSAPITISSLSYNLKYVLKKNNLKKITAHGLRHTYASLLYAEGVDIKTISKLLGHSSINITLNTYTHVFKELESVANKNIERIFETKVNL